MVSFREHKWLPAGDRNMGLRLITSILFGIWLLLVLAGKGGFVHLLLLNAIGVGAVDLVGRYRSRMAV